MDTKSICPSCQKPLAPDVPMGLCPECLIKAGFPTGGETETGARSAFTPPTVEAIARLFPQLEVLELIGKGGMGAVYKARQKRLNRFVALKILPPGIGQEPAFAERFTREAQALAQLNHPGIVTLYEFGETEGQFYFLMEFVDGVNLRQLLANSRVSTREALAIVPQICDALQFAHDQGIVHRDIKPENILMDRRGRVKVADFGLAKIIGSEATSPFGVPPSGGSDRLKPELQTLTDAGKVMGTPQYMSPEQIQAPGEVDHRADIYALGVVFYQMLTGELPGKKIAPPSQKVHIDVRLDEIVLRALEKKPELRYQQVSEVKTLVETIVATPPGSSRREDAQTENLASGIRKSQMVHLVETLFGVTFTSGRAILGINLSALGFLGFLSYLSYLPLNWARKFEVFSGAFGLFGLIGVAFVFEFWARRRKSGTTPSGTSRRVDAQIENPEIEIRKSPMVRLVETLTGVIFTSGRAILGINFSILGFLGFLGYLSYLPSAWARKFQAFSYAFGLFGLIGMAFVFEFLARLKKSGTNSPGGSRGEEALTENSEIGNRKSEMVPHFSSTAIVGIAWAAFGVISAIQILAVRHISITELNDSVWWRVLNLFGQPVLALTAIPGTTMLGWIAVTQIRRSAGILHGMGLALFDGLLFPLLALDAVVGIFWMGILRVIFNDHRLIPVVCLLALATMAWVDWFIIRRVWRAVNKDVAGAVPGSSRREEAQTEKSESGNPKPGIAPRLSLKGFAVVVLWVTIILISAIMALGIIKSHYTNPAIVLSQSEFFNKFNADEIANATIELGGDNSQLHTITGNYFKKDQDGKATKEEVSFVAPNVFLNQKMLDELLVSDKVEVSAPNAMLMNSVWTVAPILFLGIVGIAGLGMLLLLGFFLRRVWRGGTPPAAPARGSYPGKMMGIGFGGSVLIGVLLVLLLLALKVHHQLSTIDQIAANPLGDAGARELNSPPFVARLNQAEVELVAIGNQPWTNPVCWLPNGALMSKPFPAADMDLGGSSGNQEMEKMAFRIHNESADKISYPVCRINAESGVLPQGSGWQPVDPRDPDDGYYQIIACPTNAATMNVSLGVANGAWETAITLRHDHGIGNGLGGAESFASPTEGEWSATYNAVIGHNDVAINCNYTKNTNWASQMVAVNEGGKLTVIPENSSSVSTLQTGGMLMVSSNEFVHTKEFRLQRRKYQWAEFRNVALQPGLTTTVVVKENIVKPVAAIQPSAQPTNVVPPFDTMIECVVTNAFSFATGGQSQVAWADGKRLELSSGTSGTDKEKFLREHDIDLFTDDGLGLYGIDVKVTRAAWDPQISYERLAWQLQSSNRYTLYGMSGVCFTTPGTMPAYWFETRTGLTGILQITGFTKSPPGVKIRYKLVHEGSAPFADSPAPTNAPAVEQAADQKIARLKLEQAEREVKAAEQKFSVGTITEYELQKIKLERDIAAAEVEGDPVEVARRKLAMADLDLDVIGKKVALGLAPPSEYDQAKLARDTAAARYKQAQTADDSSHR